MYSIVYKKGIDQMEFRTLRYFLAVARERNITRAAEKLHMAQPPLTRQIKLLEAELGVPLLIRGGRQLQLTEEGRFLQERGSEILQLLETTQQQLEQLGPETHGVLSLCTTEASGSTLLSELIAAFHQSAPGIRFQVLAGSGTESQDRLEKNLADMGIVREPFNLEPYDRIFLRQEPWGILCSQAHPLAARNQESVELAWLEEIPLMLPLRQSAREEILSWFGHPLSEQNIFCLYTSIASILGLAERGLGVIVAPQSVRAFTDPSKLAYRTILRPGHQSQLFLVKRRAQMMTPAAARFWQFVQAYIAPLTP